MMTLSITYWTHLFICIGPWLLVAAIAGQMLYLWNLLRQNDMAMDKHIKRAAVLLIVYLIGLLLSLILFIIFY